jgi:hypothetical protein
MNAKIQTVQLFNDGRTVVAFDFLDANGQPVKPASLQFDCSPALLAAVLAECQAAVDGKVADVTDDLRAGSLVAKLKQLDDTKAAIAAAETELAAKVAAVAVDAVPK